MMGRWWVRITLSASGHNVLVMGPTHILQTRFNRTAFKGNRLWHNWKNVRKYQKKAYRYWEFMK